MNYLTISNLMFHEDGVNISSKNKSNGEINPIYLIDTIKFCNNEEVQLRKFRPHPCHQGSGRIKMTPTIPPKTRLYLAPMILPSKMNRYGGEI